MPYYCSKRRCKGTKKKAYGERDLCFSLVICMGKAILLSLHINHVYMESIHPTSRQRQTGRKSGKHRALLFLALLALFSSFLSCFQDDESDDNTPVVIPEGFVCVAHRGYHPKGVAENSALAYRHAKFAGFDYGETDIQWTKDDIPVCCHDEFFIDNYTKAKIKINEHTCEELKSKFHYYYGTYISTLEEVMAECKDINLGLYIDHFDYFEGKRNKIMYSLINNFGKEKVCYLFDNLNKKGINQVLQFDPKATIILVCYDKLNNSLIKFANEIKTDSNKVILNLPFQSNSISKLLSNYHKLKKGVGYGVWTVNHKSTFAQYQPYVESITSDSLCH